MSVAMGLPRRKVIWTAARNAILPSIANLSLAIGLVVSGALLVELVFNYPGVGDLLLNAVRTRTTPSSRGSSCHHAWRSSGRTSSRTSCTSHWIRARGPRRRRENPALPAVAQGPARTGHHGFFLLLTDCRSVPRALQPRQHIVRAGPHAVVASLVRHDQPGPGHLLPNVGRRSRHDRRGPGGRPGGDRCCRRLIGVSAGYIGGVTRRRTIAGVQRLPRDPRFAPADRDRQLPAGEQPLERLCHRARDRADRLGVGSARTARADHVTAQQGLHRGVQDHR
jgi:hypothetical protein